MVGCGDEFFCCFCFFFLKTTTATTKISFFFTLGVSSPETPQGQSKEGNDFQLWGGGKHYLVAQAPVWTSFGRFYNYFLRNFMLVWKSISLQEEFGQKRRKGCVCINNDVFLGTTYWD